jgi:hypothetical protein
MINTLKFAETLEREAKMPAAEARAFAHAFAEATREDLATKEDLRVLSAELRGEMGALGAALRGEMGALDAGLRGEMAGLRADMDKLYWRVVATVAGMLLVNLAGVYAILWSAIGSIR